MTDSIMELIKNFKLSHEVTSFIISLLPILELRGGLIYARLNELPMIKAFLICYTANVLPIPFILLFIRKIFAFMKRFKKLGKFVTYLENKAMKKSESVAKKQMLGLFAFVALPLPGTGGWTGALIASILNMDMKKSFFVIIAGVFTAGLIMVTLAYFIPGLFGFNV